MNILGNKTVLLAGLLITILIAGSFSAFQSDNTETSNQLHEITLTRNNSIDWQRGKLQPSKTDVKQSSLAIRDGKVKIDYWESQTFQAENISHVDVFASVPANTSAYLKIITHSGPDFQAPNGAYRRSEERTFELKGGKNSFKPERFNESYFRIFFQLERTDKKVKSPEILSYRVSGSKYKQNFLYP